MANKIEQYECSFCFAHWETLEQAEICEKNHSKIDKITQTNYNKCDWGPPSSIIVRFTDGSFYAYKKVEE